MNFETKKAFITSYFGVIIFLYKDKSVMGNWIEYYFILDKMKN
jgi:hypothetical protein